MATIHENYLKQFLDKHNNQSYLGTQLIDILHEQFPELTQTNCRRIIYNALQHALIRSSAPMTFGNNQYAYFSEATDFGYEILSEHIQTYKKALHRVIFALFRNNGVLTFLEAQKISGATLTNESHSVSFDSILNDLHMLQLIETHRIGETCFITQKRMASSCIAGTYSDLKNMNLLLNLSLNWLVRTNMIDAKQLCYMGESNAYNGIERNNEIWDAFGFSNAVGLGNRDKEFQTVVLIDFLSNHTYEEYDFSGFKERVDRVIYSTSRESRKTHRKVLPIIFSHEISPAALSLIKKSGYLYFNITSLLGKNALDITRNFTTNISRIEEKIYNKDSDFEREIADSLNEIRESGNETNYGNLKGQLFEYLMYPVIQKIYGQNAIITHSFSGSMDNKKFECDYLVETDEENVVIELKGYDKGNIIMKGVFEQSTQKYTPNSVLWFLNQTFHLCCRLLGTRKFNRFCYITTADLSEDAKNELLSRKRNKPSKLECFYTHDSLLKLLEQYEMENEIKVIKQFYM